MLRVEVFADLQIPDIFGQCVRPVDIGVDLGLELVDPILAVADCIDDLDLGVLDAKQTDRTLL